MKRLLAIIKSMDDKTYKVFLVSDTEVVTECDGEVVKTQYIKLLDYDEVTLQLTFPIKSADLCLESS